MWNFSLAHFRGKLNQWFPHLVAAAAADEISLSVPLLCPTWNWEASKLTEWAAVWHRRCSNKWWWWGQNDEMSLSSAENGIIGLAIQNRINSVRSVCAHIFLTCTQQNCKPHCWNTRAERVMERVSQLPIESHFFAHTAGTLLSQGDRVDCFERLMEFEKESHEIFGRRFLCVFAYRVFCGGLDTRWQIYKTAFAHVDYTVFRVAINTAAAVVVLNVKRWAMKNNGNLTFELKFLIKSRLAFFFAINLPLTFFLLTLSERKVCIFGHQRFNCTKQFHQFFIEPANFRYSPIK
jgi:hypothetical protein